MQKSFNLLRIFDKYLLKIDNMRNYEYSKVDELKKNKLIDEVRIKKKYFKERI